MHFVLEYDLVADYVTRREPLRATHLELARAATVRGELVLAGALQDPVDRALLLFRGPGPEAAERFAKADPYVANGLVREWRVRPWATVVGPDAENLLPDEAAPKDEAGASHEGLLRFLRGARYGVVASIGGNGDPQAAVVGVAVTDRLELVFDTLGSTRKAENLRKKGRAAVVFTRGSATAQIEGDVDEPSGDELERVRAAYYEAFPDGRERASWPGITWFRVRPTWVRTSSFASDPPAVVELPAEVLAQLTR